MDLKKLKIIFIHGNSGGSVCKKNQWFPYLKAEFEKLGLKVVARNFPDRDLARAKYWLPFLKNILKADVNSIIIGASSGAQAAMRFAEENKIIGSILVSPCYTDLGDKKEKISGYYSKLWQWKKIRNNQKWIVQFYSTDDPYIPVREAKYVHKHLKTEYHEFTDQGHFYPKYEFPEIVAVVKKKLGLK